MNYYIPCYFPYSFSTTAAGLKISIMPAYLMPDDADLFAHQNISVFIPKLIKWSKIYSQINYSNPVFVQMCKVFIAFIR